MRRMLHDPLFQCRLSPQPLPVSAVPNQKNPCCREALLWVQDALPYGREPQCWNCCANLLTGVQQPHQGSAVPCTAATARSPRPGSSTPGWHSSGYSSSCNASRCPSWSPGAASRCQDPVIFRGTEGRRPLQQEHQLRGQCHQSVQ